MGGCLFEVGANSRLGAYSNKYSILVVFTQQLEILEKTLLAGFAG